MGSGKTITFGRLTFAALVCVVSLPNGLRAAPGVVQPNLTDIAALQLQGASPANLYAPTVLFATDSEWPATNPWLFAPSRYRSAAAPAFDDRNSPVFDIASYDAMWDDTLFSEVAAYGGLNRDLQRVASMKALGGSDGTEGVPYGRLTLQREFLEGHQHIGLGAYGLHANVRPTAISGFGDDSYTDVAADGTWRWLAHPERAASAMIALHILLLHEDEGLNASHAVFGTRTTDDLSVLRGDVSGSWGGPVTPAIQYFQINGTSDPVRLGTLDGSPDSKGWVAEIDYAPWNEPVSPLARLNVRFALQFVAYSEFDGSSRNAPQNDTVLLHVTMGAGPDS